MADGSNSLVDMANADGAPPTGTLPAGIPQQAPQLTPPQPQSGGRMAMPGAGLPNIIQLLAGVLKPQQGQATPGQAPQRPNSRLDVFENFLGNFLSSFAAGMGQSGQRGAEGKGFAAAVQQPIQRSIQQQQLGMQQRQVESQEGLRQAQEEFNRQRATQFSLVPMTVNGPDGKPEQIMVPQNAVGRIQSSIESAGARKEAATTAAQAKIAAMNPIQKMIDDAYADYKSGKLDAAGLQKKIQDTAGAASAATRQQKADNEISLIQRMNAGDPKARQDWQTLQAGRVAVRSSIANQRPMTFYDTSLQRNITLAAGEAERRQKEGEVLLPAGPVSAQTILQMQRAQNAIPAAVDEVAKNLKAWDNTGDRAIFARVIKDTPTGGDPSTWFGNILNQAANSGLSDEGQKAVVRLRRLNESLGTLRAISGLPATAGSMMATAALLPGGATPSSKMAKDQLDQIKTLVQQETGVKFLGGSGNTTEGTALTKEQAMKYLQDAGGDKNKARVMARKDGFKF